ncbi:Hypothetical predicted protein [Cloeon dipterum]|uniref:Metalloendopeptidase n=1 Tax=Cloeon dipterum TaxID=197152 RepID=A0A8S1DUD1_9INSE|nr:Hypothetical predicted protein [Cloeon dipterum]
MFRITFVVLACVAAGMAAPPGKPPAVKPHQYNLVYSRVQGELKNRWPNGRIPYVISDDDYDEYQVKIIKQAMEVFNTRTKVRFVPKEAQDEDFVLIADRGRCSSPLGRIGGVQVLSLKSPVCVADLIVLRKLMSTVGLEPEHNRPDRDDYITILWDNVQPKSKDHFKKFGKSFVDTNVPYDYNSITHYSPKAFSANGKDTMIAKDPNIKLGPGKTLTELDIRKINLMYEDAKDNDDDNGTSSDDACNKRIQKIIDFSKAILLRELFVYDDVLQQTGDYCQYQEQRVTGRFGSHKVWNDMTNLPYCMLDCIRRGRLLGVKSYGSGSFQILTVAILKIPVQR